MPDSAYLACYDHALILPLGMFGPADPPGVRELFDETGSPMSARGPWRAALWKLLAGHAGDDVRLLGEDSEWAQAYDFPRLPDVADSGDITFADFLGDWPAGASVPAGPGVREVALHCSTDAIVLPLGRIDTAGPPGRRCLYDPAGRPSMESDELNLAVWRFLAEHVYHDVRLDLRPR
jgi:hypothetical protein